MVKPTADPVLNIASPIPHMLPDTEPRRTQSPMTPRVDGGDGHAEVIGKTLDGEQLFETIHTQIVRPDPLTRRSLDAHSMTIFAFVGVSGGCGSRPPGCSCCRASEPIGGFLILW